MARVLVVDDDLSTVRIVAARLRSAGHEVMGAPSAQEALQLIAVRGLPDVVVLDVSMPETSGPELLAILRAQEGLGEVPAIFLSARVLPEQIEAGRAMGASFLTKPFIAAALLNAIDEAVGSRLDTW
ncbi:response regulator [Kineosporia rhizophila]|uniref:response regulator n=1 Tax=Kineosporia TaxID=49184 RepID=UPI000B02EC3B|nr:MULTISPECIES: response regulator [Kineosporia]MCE0533911.1 response regulator [Kineosporia rhizophila]GLY13450.1 hypothetical protein Kisp01_04660 [Kineosporia sp. NBRC 101677]